MPGTRCLSGREVAASVQDYCRKKGQREGRRLYARHLSEALKAGDLRPSDFSIRELFEGLVKDGSSIVRQWQLGEAGYGVELLEAGGSTAVGYADFSNITGQIFFTEVLEKYEHPDFVFSKEIEKKASIIQDVEKIPGIARIGSTTRGIGEGQEYPRYGVSEDYIEVPAKRKDGGIVEVTKEIIAGDKTGVLTDRCGELGYWLGYGLEERVCDALLDQGANALSAYQGGHRYTWKGTAYATYQASTPWVNVKTTNALTDETVIDAAWQVLVAITDPYTGKPIMLAPDALVVAPDLVFRATRLLAATEIRQTAPGFATTGSPATTISPPAIHQVIPGLRVLSSPILKARMQAASETTTDWFLGSVRKQVRQYYNWDIITAQRSTGTDAEFERDVVMQFKASLKDCVSTVQPRAMVKSSA